jgi:hypothetical protein
VQDRPTIDEMLEAVANFLTDDVMAATSGRVNFHARVAANGLQMLRREIALREEHLWRERDSLDRLMPNKRPRPDYMHELIEEVAVDNQKLAERIRAGDAESGTFREATIAHLKLVTRDKLAVTNPAWIVDE